MPALLLTVLPRDGWQTAVVFRARVNRSADGGSLSCLDAVVFATNVGHFRAANGLGEDERMARQRQQRRGNGNPARVNKCRRAVTTWRFSRDAVAVVVVRVPVYNVTYADRRGVLPLVEGR